MAPASEMKSSFPCSQSDIANPGFFAMFTVPNPHQPRTPPLPTLDLTIVRAELVPPGAARPRTDVLVASVQPDAFPLCAGVEPLAEVEGGDDVEEGFRGVAFFFDAESFGRLDEGRADVQAAAVFGGDDVAF